MKLLLFTEEKYDELSRILTDYETKKDDITIDDMYAFLVQVHNQYNACEFEELA